MRKNTANLHITQYFFNLYHIIVKKYIFHTLNIIKVHKTLKISNKIILLLFS